MQVVHEHCHHCRPDQRDCEPLGADSRIARRPRLPALRRRMRQQGGSAWPYRGADDSAPCEAVPEAGPTSKVAGSSSHGQADTRCLQ